MNATNSNLSRPLTSPAFSVAPNDTRKNMKAKIETNLECRDGSAVPMQRLQIAWSDCIWTPKVSRVSQVKNARPYLVLHFINTTTFVASIFGSGEARRGSIPRSGAVTEEQRSRNRKATQPSGRRCFSAQTLLLTPYRPMKGMRVARVSSGPKIPRRKRGCIYETEYLGPRRGL